MGACVSAIFSMIMIRYFTFPNGLTFSNKFGRTGKPCPAKEPSIAARVSASSDGLGSGSLLDQFCLDRDLDLVSYNHSACLGQGVPDEAEVFAVDFRRRRHSSPDIAPGILHGSRGTFDVKGDFLRDAANRQIAGQLEILCTQCLDSFRPERKCGVIRHIEEIRPAKVFV